MEKLGFLAIILVWGGLIYFLLLNGSILTEFGTNFFASVISTVSGDLRPEPEKAINEVVDNRENFKVPKIYSK